MCRTFSILLPELTVKFGPARSLQRSFLPDASFGGSSGWAYHGLGLRGTELQRRRTSNPNCPSAAGDFPGTISNAYNDIGVARSNNGGGGGSYRPEYVNDGFSVRSRRLCLGVRLHIMDYKPS